MRLYKFEITNVPSESLHIVGRIDGKQIFNQNPDWAPDGWVEYLNEMADQGARWAKNAINEGYKFFWPSEDRLYRSRSSAQEKVSIVERWGGKAVLLEADVSEFVPVVEANRRRAAERARARANRLVAEANRIRAAHGLLPAGGEL